MLDACDFEKYALVGKRTEGVKNLRNKVEREEPEIGTIVFAG